MHKRFLPFAATALAVTGAGIAFWGVTNNLAHFDTGYDASASYFDTHAVIIGYTCIALAPILIKKFIWTAILLALAVAFYLWVTFS